MGSINCYIPNRSGDKIEIDMIMLCQKGIYVIENKKKRSFKRKMVLAIIPNTKFVYSLSRCF